MLGIKKKGLTAYAYNEGPYTEQASAFAQIGQRLCLPCTDLLDTTEYIAGQKGRQLSCTNVEAHYENTPIQIYRKFHLQKKN